MPSFFTRRSILKRTASLVTASLVAPHVVPRRAFGANDRISVGMIGVGNQGSGNLKRFQIAGADIVAVCDVEIGHRSATVCHLGNIVARLGRSVRWDPLTETILGDSDAHSMVDRPHRSPYS